jgi:hypothetical protein
LLLAWAWVDGSRSKPPRPLQSRSKQSSVIGKEILRRVVSASTDGTTCASHALSVLVHTHISD